MMRRPPSSRRAGRVPLALAFGLLWGVVRTVQGATGGAPPEPDPAPRPNILLVITDDQGWGDFGFHGNPLVRTPNLDRLASESVELTNFHVSPVCSPTRASLLTGRWNYRTGVVDTWRGRSSMHADETTLAEILREAGYRTGIFGKWHLGDNAPLRPMDQGFDTSLVHGGGGITQPADPPGNRYMNPVLKRNGREERFEGYCSDIFTDAAIEFMSDPERSHPFFAYVAFNAPHTPLETPPAPDFAYDPKDLAFDRLPRSPGRSVDEKTYDPATTAKVYSMISNIDWNIGRMLDALDRHGVADDTFVVFLTDNGPQQARFNGGLRGLKGTVYEGGVRVPCLLRGPGVGRPNARLLARETLAHVDVAPTLLELCGVASPADARFDGMSFAGILQVARTEDAERRKGEIEDALRHRRVFLQWHRGERGAEGRSFAAYEGRLKLVAAGDPHREDARADSVPELFDLDTDPFEQHDLAARRPEDVARLMAAYREWFADVADDRDFAPPRIWLGSDLENPVTLTRQDWRGPNSDWRDTGAGDYEVDFRRQGTYRVELRWPEAWKVREASVVAVPAVEHPDGVFGATRIEPPPNSEDAPRPPRATPHDTPPQARATFDLPIPEARPATLVPRLVMADGSERGPHYVTVERIP